MNTAEPPGLRLHRAKTPAAALGLAVNHMMAKPAFASLRFGEWSRILAGQINRGHYYFVVDANSKVLGFLGWALTTREKAEEWAANRRGLSYEDSLAGECVVFNAWSADDAAVHRFMIVEARKLFIGKESIYYKRFYEDGSIRVGRMNANDFISSHIARTGSA
jgi:hemolysin-activating ACP:hemolysin acyltransferase